MGAAGDRGPGWKRERRRRSWLSHWTKRPPWVAGVVEPEPGLDGGPRGRLGTVSWITAAAAASRAAPAAAVARASWLAGDVSDGNSAERAGRGPPDRAAPGKRPAGGASSWKWKLREGGEGGGALA